MQPTTSCAFLAVLGKRRKICPDVCSFHIPAHSTFTFSHLSLCIVKTVWYTVTTLKIPYLWTFEVLAVVLLKTQVVWYIDLSTGNYSHA